MKTKRFLAVVAMLPLALGLFSCKNEPKKEEILGKETTQMKGVTIQITLPGKEKTTVDTRAIQDNPEWAIDQLWLYEFDKDGKKIVADPINIRNSADFKLSGMDAHYTYKAEWKKDEVRQFYFVANMEQLSGIHKDSSMEDFMKTLHSKEMTSKSSDILYDNDPNLYAQGQAFNIAGDNQKRIPMTGHATQGSNGNHSISVYSNAVISVKLVRTVARIDIVNHIPGLKITKLELFNAFKKSKVFENGTADLTDNILTTAVEAFATLTAENQIGKREGTAIKKAFYLYEGINFDDTGLEIPVPTTDYNDVTYVKITAQYGKGINPDTGKFTETYDRIFYIPFKQKYNGEFNSPINVRRNHLYKIVIGDPLKPVKDGKITFKVVEEMWNAHDFEEVVVPPTGESSIEPEDWGDGGGIVFPLG